MPPTNVSEIHGFLVLARFYHRFIEIYLPRAINPEKENVE
jgi:hypothetical protein